MELKSQDKINNQIIVLLVSPRSNRLYDYYIDGHPDKRTMLQKKMIEFCIELCPDYAEEIRRCIYELIPFVLFLDKNEFKELRENDPPKLNRKELLFPMYSQVKQDKIDLSRVSNDSIKNISKNFSIWEQYNLQLGHKKQNSKFSIGSLFK